MSDPLPRYTFRVNRLLLNKLAYVADYEGRSVNKQLEHLVKKCIAEFEAANGEIQIEDVTPRS